MKKEGISISSTRNRKPQRILGQNRGREHRSVCTPILSPLCLILLVAKHTDSHKKDLAALDLSFAVLCSSIKAHAHVAKMRACVHACMHDAGGWAHTQQRIIHGSSSLHHNTYFSSYISSLND